MDYNSYSSIPLNLPYFPILSILMNLPHHFYFLYLLLFLNTPLLQPIIPTLVSVPKKWGKMAGRRSNDFWYVDVVD